MAKKIATVLKLNLQAGKATPAYPVGPALGQHGVNIRAFVKEYNERTADKIGNTIPAEVTIFEDRSFSFVTKAPPTGDLLLKAAGVEKGAARPNTAKVGKVTRVQLEEIARVKMAELNTWKLDKAVKMIEGTARSMGIEVV
ncbi:MAG TPA: 50S ribosomal protein L11 [Chloroflexia bacterium]|nr:50S ribosomal protein L11 [Chloroflexia bacterium]